MIGYSGETKVFVLRKDEDNKTFVSVIDLKDVTNNDYVMFIHIPSRSIRFYKNKLVTGDYDGKLQVIEFEENSISISKDQKVLIAKETINENPNIIDESLLSEIKEEESLIKEEGMSCMWSKEIEESSLKEYALFFEDSSKSNIALKQQVIKNVTQKDFKGTLYNFNLPIEFVLKTMYCLGTVTHN